MEKIKLTAKREEIVNMMGFTSIMSVLRFYPYRYDYYKSQKLEMSLHDKVVTVDGMVTKIVSAVPMAKGTIRIIFLVKNKEDEVKVIMFNSYMALRYIKVNVNIVVSGKYNAFANEITLQSYFIGSLNGKEKFTPLYSIPSKIRDYTYRQFVSYIYENALLLNIIKDNIPEDLNNHYRLVSLPDALKYIHNPESSEQLKEAYRKLKYEELLNFCTLGALRRKLYNEGKKESKKIDYGYIRNFIHNLPFKLTDDQKNSLKDILNDLDSTTFMSRLLQGDVGSGKTIVATIASLAAVKSGYQTAIMAPTDILARQHFKTITEFFKNENVSITLLVSDLPGKEKNELLKKIKDGKTNIIIGTHALIQENVVFDDLGLCVIDEQHRFGVKQRIALKEKGNQIDCLYMSATPIPRTLASTIYLDMDVSTIETYPYKERIIHTKYNDDNSMKKDYAFLNEYLKSGQQIYVVCPSITDGEEDINSVTTIYESYKRRFKDYPVAFLHGKLKNEEKEQIMSDFASGKTKILISTTVIEVGINVKNANMMIVYNAERFGLASLHQLRGRIARDGSVGYCYLLSKDDNEDVKERLNFMSSCNDGFKISEYDLKRRGTGELLGLMQSGKSDFKIANIIEDLNILKTAGKDAKMIVNNPQKYKTYIDYIKRILTSNGQYVE